MVSIGSADSMPGGRLSGMNGERPIRLRAVWPDPINHDVTERDALPVVLPGGGGFIDDVGVLGDLGAPGESDRVAATRVLSSSGV